MFYGSVFRAGRVFVFEILSLTSGSRPALLITVLACLRVFYHDHGPLLRLWFSQPLSCLTSLLRLNCPLLICLNITFIRRLHHCSRLLSEFPVQAKSNSPNHRVICCLTYHLGRSHKSIVKLQQSPLFDEHPSSLESLPLFMRELPPGRPPGRLRAHCSTKPCARWHAGGSVPVLLYTTQAKLVQVGIPTRGRAKLQREGK